MRKLLLLVLIFMMPLLVMGEESVLANSRMLASGINGDFPDGFTPKENPTPTIWRKYKPNNGRSALFRHLTPDRGGICDVRGDACLYMVPGEQYLFRIWVRTKNYHCGTTGFVAFAPGWVSEFGFRGFPENSDWHCEEHIATAPLDKGKMFSFAIFADRFDGELEVAAPEILPYSEGAKADGFFAKTSLENLIPCGRKCDMLRSGDVLYCRWYENEGQERGETVSVAIDGQEFGEVSFDENDVIAFPLDLPAGEHEISLATGNFSRTIPLNLKEALPEAQAPVRLNNLNYQLYQGTVEAGEEIRFVNPRIGFVEFLLPEGAEVRLVSPELTCRNGEAAYLEPGEYLFVLKEGTADVKVCAIAETMIYPLANSPLLPGLKKYDWNFTQKHLLPSFNEFVAYGDGIPRDELAKVLARGHHRMFCSMSSMEFFALPRDREQMKQVLDSHGAYTGENPLVSKAVIVDEIESAVPMSTQLSAEIADYFPPMDGRSFYLWTCGGVIRKNSDVANYLYKTGMCSPDTKHIFEIYFNTEATEQEAMASLDRRFQFLKNLLALSPDTAGVHLSHVMMPFKMNLYFHPEVNFKYFLDMQFNYMANNPGLDGLPLVGYWGDHYAEREITRFIAALARYYVIEGNTEMLSEKLGFTYRPGHLLNGSFGDGLNNWEAEGQIEASSYINFGRDVLHLLGGIETNVGDTFALLTRGETANILRQTATGLEPGKLYSLSFISGSADTMGDGDQSGIRIECEIPGVEILPEESEHSRAETSGRGNYDKIVFRAATPEQEIILNDEQHKAGTRCWLNFVSLMPFFED